MSLRDIGLLAVDSSRTRAYLSALSKHDLLPAYVVYLTGGPKVKERSFPAVPYFDNLTPALEIIRAKKLSCKIVDTADVNDSGVIEAVKACPVEGMVYSGPGGAILRRGLLNAGTRFLHIHPGLVPEFRGSTTMYYSLLVAGNCGASAILLDEGIDTGLLLATATYPPPVDRTMIDHGYDPYVRSDLLVRVLQRYQVVGEFHARPQDVSVGETYYIMHPVLRHVAILSTYCEASL